MKTYRFEPAIGQRYVRRQLGIEDKTWTITSISESEFFQGSTKLRFTNELSGHVFDLTSSHLAQQVLVRTLRPQESAATTTDSAPLALTDLIMRMSDGQRQRFKIRCSYVQAINRNCPASSPKSKIFVRVVTDHHTERLLASKLREENSDNPPDAEIEASPPAATSVYRWFLRYRKASNDMSALAQEALATHTRTPRKAKEHELLTAFLSNRLATIANHPVSALTADFNRLMARTDPLGTDDLIESLSRDTQAIIQQNRNARRGKKSMKRPAQKTPMPNQ